MNNDKEAGGAVGCRGVAKLRTAPNISSPAAMLDVADGPNTPPLIVTGKIKAMWNDKILGDELGGTMRLGNSLINCNTSLPSSHYIQAFKADITSNLDVG